MCKLLRAGVSRYIHNPLTWICLAAAVFCGVWGGVHIRREYMPDWVYFVGLFLVQAVLSSLLIGAELGNGMHRNKLVCGYTRGMLFFSELILALGSILILCISFLVPFVAILLPLLGIFPGELLGGMLLSFILLHLSLGCIFVTLSCLISRRVISSVLCLLIVIAMVWGAYQLFVGLLQPETIQTGAEMIGNELVWTTEPNPNYIGGWKRIAFQIAVRVLPFGQLLEMLEISDRYFWVQNPYLSDYKIETLLPEITSEQGAMIWSLPLYSIVLMAVLCMVGYLCFRKKEFK